MLKKIGISVLSAAALIGIIGCDTGLIVGSKSMGMRSGEFIYTDGYVVYAYSGDFEQIWQAVEAVMKDLKAYEIQREKKIAKGTISGLIAEEKITIKVTFQERDKVHVAVLVGMGGSKIAAGAIHDKITHKLAKS